MLTKQIKSEFKAATAVDQIAMLLRSKSANLVKNEQYWIGLAGAPGSGKSSLSSALKERLGEMICVIPMDGYHFYRCELDAMPNPINAYALRGAPFTFNAHKFVDNLIAAKQARTGKFPSFDHNQGDPVEEDIELLGISKIVLVEGNYLFLNEEPWCQLRTNVFDESWFLNVPIAECKRRVIKRHIETGLNREEAQHRVDNNDGPNAQRVIVESIRNADRIISIE